jgi:hypothetical protein
LRLNPWYVILLSTLLSSGEFGLEIGGIGGRGYSAPVVLLKLQRLLFFVFVCHLFFLIVACLHNGGWFCFTLMAFHQANKNPLFAPTGVDIEMTDLVITPNPLFAPSLVNATFDDPTIAVDLVVTPHQLFAPTLVNATFDDPTIAMGEGSKVEEHVSFVRPAHPAPVPTTKSPAGKCLVFFLFCFPCISLLPFVCFSCISGRLFFCPRVVL